MSNTSSEPAPPPPDLTPAYQSFKHYTSLVFLFGAPLLIALPPRKLDIYTFGLGSSWALSANHLYKERRLRQQQGDSPFGGKAATATATAEKKEGSDGATTKTRYEMVQEQLRREKEEGRRGGKGRRLLELVPDGAGAEADVEAAAGEDGQGGRPKSAIERGLEKVWMGGEKAGWKERRLAEEQEKILRGEGYGGMIMDQIWEVWNWGKEKGEELEERDREVLKERRRREEFPEIGKENSGK